MCVFGVVLTPLTALGLEMDCAVNVHWYAIGVDELPGQHALAKEL